MQHIRSFIFNILMYVMMLVIALLYFPMAIFSRAWAYRACHAYCVYIRWSLRVIVGLDTEVRGTPPTDAVVVAAKHQSFLDILLIFGAIPRGKFIMKRELIYAPLIGQYGLRIGCIPVDRGKRGAAMEKLKKDVARGLVDPGQLIIYPQGTRVAPGVKKPYKVGTGVLYEQLGQPCVPVATNVGYFWPKRAVLRKPGLAVVEFLDPIPTGLTVKEFMNRLETAIEPRSDALLEEAKAADRD